MTNLIAISHNGIKKNRSNGQTHEPYKVATVLNNWLKTKNKKQKPKQWRYTFMFWIIESVELLAKRLFPRSAHIFFSADVKNTTWKTFYLYDNIDFTNQERPLEYLFFILAPNICLVLMYYFILTKSILSTLHYYKYQWLIRPKMAK